MLKSNRFSLLTLYLLTLTILLTACENAKIKKGEAVEVYFNRGVGYFDAGKYGRAVKVFDAILDDFPYSNFTIMAQMKKGEALTKQKKYDEALLTLEEFQRMHPQHEELAKIIYLTGYCYYKKIDAVDREQLFTHKTVEYFTRLNTRYPDNAYAKEAETYLADCRERMAAYELYVGKFYFRQHKYQAAIERFNYLNEHFPEAKVMPQALYFWGRTYFKLADKQKATATFSRLIQDYPKDELVPEAQEYLERIKSIKTEPVPEKNS